MQRFEKIVLALELARSHVSAMLSASLLVMFNNTFSLEQCSPLDERIDGPQYTIAAGGVDEMGDFFTGTLGTVT
jgi:hypothetical protein